MGSATVFATREILAKPEFQTSIAGSIFALVFLVAIMLGVPLALTVLAWRRWRRNRKAARQLQLAVQTARATASPLLSPNRS
jgi:ABC-type protease/lipase transport system fused ATPase/permease subunit